MVVERLVHHDAEALLDALNPFDDALDVEVEVGEVAAAQVLEPPVDVVLLCGVRGRGHISSITVLTSRYVSSSISTSNYLK